jgi:hypothetical protein
VSEPFDVVVRPGDCPCPGTPHTDEHVFLEPELTMPVASAAMAAMRWSESTTSAQQAAIIEAYLPASIREWTFTGDDRKPIPIDREEMERLLPWDRGGLEVAEAADLLYSERLMRPLLARIQKLSQPTSTDTSTSPTPEPGSEPREPSEPSSPPDSEEAPMPGMLYAVQGL